MADPIIQYPLDLTGVAASNLIQSEAHVLDPGINRTIVPNYGAFYTQSGFSIKDMATGEVLTPITQYVPVMFWAEPTEQSGLEVCVGIVIVDSNVSANVEIDYQVVGGDYSDISSLLIDLLATLEIDDRIITWGDLLGVPDFFPTAPHLHPIGDIYGFEHIVASLDALRNVLVNSNSSAIEEIRQMVISSAEASIGLVDGMQPLDPSLTSLSNLFLDSNKMLYGTGFNEYGTTTLTPFARTVLDDIDASTTRATLGAAASLNAALTGIPTAPTALISTDTTQIANTAFVMAEIDVVATAISSLSSAVTNGLASKQPLDETLTGIAALTVNSSQLIYGTGPDTFGVTTLTAFARTILDDVDAAAVRLTLGTAAKDSAALTGLPTAPTALQTVNDTQIATTSYVRTAIGDFETTNTIALNGKQPLDATLTGLSAVTPTAGNLLYTTATDTFAATALSAFARTILDDVDAVAVRATLGAAAKDNAALTGVPTAPTAVFGTNTTQLATTAFTQSAVNALVDAAPGVLDTLNELAAALGDDPNFATTITNELAGKQPLAAVLTNTTASFTTIIAAAVDLNTAKITNVTTNLGYVASGTQGTVTSSDGNNAIIPLATGVNAGLSLNDLTATLKSNYDDAYTHSQVAHAPSNADNTAANQTSHSDVVIDGDFTADGFLKRTAAGVYAVDTAVYVTAAALNAYAQDASVTTAPAATGLNSLAMGDSAKSHEGQTIAIGYNAIAGQTAGATIEERAVAIGSYAKAHEFATIALGTWSTAGVLGATSSPNAIAIGYSASSISESSLALGYLASASGSSSIGIGKNVSVTASAGIAIGVSASTTASGAISIGQNAVTTDSNSISIGQGAGAGGTGSGSIVLGNGSVAKDDYTIAIGSYAIAGQTPASQSEQYAIAIGRTAKAYETGGITIGFSAITGISGATTNPEAIAIGSLAEGVKSGAVGIGYSAFARGYRSVALGYLASAREYYAIAIGPNSQAGWDDGSSAELYALALGYNAKAYQEESIAIGANAVAGVTAGASDQRSIAIGGSASSLGGYGIALGWNATSSDWGLALGVSASASAANTIAIGPSSTASTGGSIAIGQSAKAAANGALALSYGSDARELGCLAIGHSTQAGQVNGASVEQYAIALGHSAKAYETGSISIGYGAVTGVNGTSINPYGLAIGYLASSGGPYSAAIGSEANSAGLRGISLGRLAKAYETDCLSLGVSSQAGQTAGGVAEIEAIALGANAKAYEAGCITLGPNAISGVNGTSADPYAIAIGNFAKADAIYSISLGHTNESRATGCISIGTGSKALEEYGIVIGHFAQTGQNANGVANVGSMAIGTNSKAYEFGGISIGYGAITGVNGATSAYYGLAVGFQASATGNASVSIGNGVQHAVNGEVHIGSSNTNKFVLSAAGVLIAPSVTVTNQLIVKEVKETAYGLIGTVIDPVNGGIQYKTLLANTTFTEALEDGQSITLMIDDGAAAYTVTWPTITWISGVAPVLPTTGYIVIVVFKMNGVLYGKF